MIESGVPSRAEFKAHVEAHPLQAHGIWPKIKNYVSGYGYTTAEIDAMFEGYTGGGKAQVHWNSVVSKPATFPPSAHAASHHVGGGDLVNHGSLTGFVANEHIDWTNASQNFQTSGGLHWGGAGAPYAYSDIDQGGLFIELVGTTGLNDIIRLQTSPSGTQANYTRLYLDPDIGVWITNTGTGKEDLRVDGNIGIGCTPSYGLHMQGVRLLMTSPGGENRVYISGTQTDEQDTYMTLYNNAAVGKITLRTNGDSYFKGGSVGINITPLALFHASGGNVYVGDEANLARQLAMRRNAATIGGLSSYGGIFSLFGGSDYSVYHIAIRDTGKVGFGTGNPEAPVHLKRTDAINPQFIIENTHTPYRAAKFWFDTGSASGFGTANYSLNIINKYTSAGDIGLRAAITGDVQFILKSAGKVGILTTDPQSELEVMGQIRALEFYAWDKTLADGGYITLMRRSAGISQPPGVNNCMRFGLDGPLAGTVFYTSYGGYQGVVIFKADNKHGFGTTTPGRTLEAISTAGDALFFGKSGKNDTSSAWLIRNSDNTTLFDLANNGVLYLLGNLGVGITPNNAAIHVPDGARIGCGNKGGGDLRIYHSGGSSYLDNTEGNFYIYGNTGVPVYVYANAGLALKIDISQQVFLGASSFYMNSSFLVANNKVDDSCKLDGQHGSYYAVAGGDPTAHVLVGALHTASGLTAGHVIVATGATTFAWAQLGHAALAGVTSDQHHAQLHETSHRSGGGDALNHDLLAGFLAGEHFLQSAITQVGTIGTGIWQGTAIANAYIAGINQNLLTSSDPTFTGIHIGDSPNKICVGASDDFVIFHTSATGHTTLSNLYHGGNTIMVCENAGGTAKSLLTLDPDLEMLVAGLNLQLGTFTPNTSGTYTMQVRTGTAPTDCALDSFQMYSKDQAAGNACPHFMTENNAIIKLYRYGVINDMGYPGDLSGAQQVDRGLLEGYLDSLADKINNIIALLSGLGFEG